MAEPTRPSVLFVCMGNICRSPTGEGVMQRLLEDRGASDRIFVDSAGTHAYHVGELPDPRMSRAAAGRGYSLISRARQVVQSDLAHFDLILAMDRDNLELLHQMAGDGRRSHIRLLSSFLPPSFPIDVPDPYYGGAQGFEDVLNMIERACPEILDLLLEL